MIKGDFHTHINGGESVLENARLIARISKEKGFSHIALGCHEWVCPTEIAEEIRKEFNIEVVRFAECICEEDVHLLVLNVEDCNNWKIKENPIEFYADEVKKQGGKIVVAHPYNKTYLEKILKLVDGVEEYNSLRAMHFDYVKDYPNLVKFKNSDFHAWEHDPFLMNTFTELPDNWFGKIKK